MARLRTAKTNFSAGELSPRLLGRTDLRAFENGAARLRNVLIHPTGGLSRRPGLRFVDSARGLGRLVAFEYSTEQAYLLSFSDHVADVYRQGVKVATFETPWSEAQLGQINWTQSADTLLVVHPDVPPQIVTRRTDAEWFVSEWTFSEKGGRIFAPHYKFAGEATTLRASGTAGSVTVTASEPTFLPDHAGVRLRMGNREVAVASVISPTQALVDVKENLASTQPTDDWTEAAFSPVRGWPTAVCFHQDRLVIGGSRDLPNRLWLSKAGKLFNFDLGDGLNDEAIEFAILSDQVNAIRAVFSGRHLQVFTSGAEWMVSGEPLTPVNIQLHRQTRIGSPVSRTVLPKDIDGATVFVARAGNQIREFLFADTEAAYQAGDLALLSDHLIEAPVDMESDKRARLLHVVMASGAMATLTIFRDEQVSAWTMQHTDGAFRSVATVGDETYVLIERNGGVFIEVFDERLNVDCGTICNAAVAQSNWSGLEHLEGRSVAVVADGVVQPKSAVAAGSIDTEHPALNVLVGLEYSHEVIPLPPTASGLVAGGQGSRIRPVMVTFRFLDTAALYLDYGRGLKEVPFRTLGDSVLDQATRLFTGDHTVRGYGWRADASLGIWRIVQAAPMPFTLLSVVTEISTN